MLKHMIGITMIVVTALPTHAEGKLVKSDRKQIKSALQGTLYLRMDLPCATGRHSFGTYKRPLVEVSPEGANTEDGNTVNASWWHADSTYWGIRINDPVELDEFEMEPAENALEIELEGVGSAEGNSTVIRLVEIQSLDDFQAAFDRAFSRTPLQDEHDDWPAEIKQAIGQRRLLDGMTKRQVFYVTGAPESFSKKEEDGKEVETWHLRQNKGMKLGFFGAKMGESTGLPESIRFENGLLVDAATTGTRSDFSIDDH